ncbi:MAG TPA: hypothetical protein VE863_01620 [Pyrinomonadaceae bacterium]|nr:hypothetical protein [Pyrinomonadaceae bacterium]
MRTRPIRPNIYLPVVRFGVADSDWFSVLLISCAGYLLPVLFGITILYVPLQMWTWLIATAGSIAFFNYIRIGKQPRWLQHRIAALVLHNRQNRAIPNGRKRRFHRDWIIKNAIDDQANYVEEPQRTTSGTFLVEYNTRFQEETVNQWNALLLTTN